MGGALRNLAKSREHRDVICEKKGIQALIQVLLNGTQKAQKAVVDAFRSLLAIEWGQRDPTLQVIQALIKVLREASPEVCQNAAVALGGLARMSQVICGEGVIQALMRVL